VEFEWPLVRPPLVEVSPALIRVGVSSAIPSIWLRFGRPDAKPDDLAPPIARHGHSDYCRHRDDAAAVADLKIGRVKPQIRPLAVERAVEEGAYPLVDVFAQLRDLALRDPREAHRLHQLVDASGRHAADPGFLNHGDQCPFRGLARLQEGREVGALAQLGMRRLNGPRRVSRVRSR
jgi:hypothetical protein